MDNDIRSCLKKFKENKSNSTLIIILFYYLNILLLLNSFLKSYELNEIRLTIQGKENHCFLHGDQDVSEVIIKGESKSLESCKKCCYFDEDLNNVTLKFNTLIDSCYDMFFEMVDIIEIDLSNFDTSNLKNMQSMFNGCNKLEKITFGNINTAQVNNMYKLFYNCVKLSSIDLSHFDTSSVINMNETFCLCKSITSLDVSKFNTEKVEGMYDMFAYCYNLTSINVSNFDTSKVKVMQGMFYSCDSLTSLDLSNFDTSSATNMNSMFAETDLLEYVYLPSFKIIEGRTCGWMFGNSNGNLKICLLDLDTQILLDTQNRKFDCSDKCFPKNYKFDLKNDKCKEFCNQSEYKYEFNNICYEICPNTTYLSDNDEYLCLNKTEEDNYYFDSDKGIYKECYHSCKKCNERGDEINNKCIQCKEGYLFLNESLSETLNNCYNKCPYNYYFNEFNDYACTDIDACPPNYNKLIKEKKKCIDDCKKDNIYQYEYNNTCYLQCPNGTNETESFICIDTPENVETEAPTTEIKTETPSTEMKTEPPTTILKIETPSTEFTIEAPSTEENKIYESQTVFNTINNCFHTCKSCFDE